MSVVPQDTFLFSDSIKNNIKFSNVPNSSAKGYTGLITNADNITDKRYVYDPRYNPPRISPPMPRRSIKAAT